jgi:hypothetical protein
MVTDPDSAGGEAPVVHALLVCRGLDVEADGGLTLRNVVEVLPVASVPADVGPLVFLALVRGLPTGRAKAAFVLRQGDEGRPGIGRLPLEMDVPAAFRGRQVALHVRLPSFPVQQAGWFELYLEWDGDLVAHTRFAVGVRG